MKLARADREIESLVREIRSGGLDLQPDFQRGEVWRLQKQQLLVDTVLRGWYIPPIHVIEHEDTRLQEVLDGQQRLRSIINFVEDEVVINGYVEPISSNLELLHDMHFSDLPESLKRAFMRFTITQYTLTNFAPAEPAELFFRLNQNMALTPAETRNAFVGAIREQVKQLVDQMRLSRLNAEALGFSNARMSYDDVMARFCIALEWNTLTRKITARDLDDRYRLGIPFAFAAVERASSAITLLGESIPFWNERVRFNKATLFSWLWFVAELMTFSPSVATPARIGFILSSFEQTRKSLDPNYLENLAGRSSDVLKTIAAIYHDRATSRVADVSSVILRDAAIWVFSAGLDRDIESALYGMHKSEPLRRRYEVGLEIARRPGEIEGLIADLVGLYAA